MAQHQLLFGSAAPVDMAVVPGCLQGLLAEQRLHNRTGNAALTEAQIVDYVRSGYKLGSSGSTFSEQVSPGSRVQKPICMSVCRVFATS